MSQTTDQAASTATDLKPSGVLTRRLVVVGFLALAVVASLAAYVFGLLSAPHGYFWVNPRGASSKQFDWPNAMLAATAAGTVILGAFTAALAYTTSGDVSATWRLAQLTAEDQAARERPVLVITSLGIGGQSRINDPRAPEDARAPVDRFDVWGQVRNVGLGPALNVDMRVRYIGPQADIEPLKDRIVLPIVTTEDSDRGDTFWFIRPYDEERPVAPDPLDEHFVIAVTYEDRRRRPGPKVIDFSRRPR